MPSLLGTAAVSPVLDLMKEAGLGPEYVVSLVLTLPPLATALSGFFIGALPLGICELYLSIFGYAIPNDYVTLSLALTERELQCAAVVEQGYLML